MVNINPAKPFLFLLTGDEFLRRHKIESLVGELIPRELRQTNLFRIYPQDLNWQETLSQAQTPSLMGGAQVFWITQADQIKKGDDNTAFESYCDHPAAESYFIFEADELSGAHPVVKLANRLGRHFHFGRRDGEMGFEAMRDKVKRSGKTLASGAWQLLQEKLGGSPRLMDIAIDQLVVYSDEPVIDESAVEKLSGEFLRYEPFDLTDALARRDISEALRILHFFYDLSNDMTSMIGLIHWQLKRIWQAKRILAQGGRREEVGRTLHIPPFRLGPFLNQVQRFDSAMVERLIDRLWQLDWDTKKGASSDATQMEMFLAGIAS
ncbi:MAG: DNA polymerase III subunit delta [Candidatus Omnitrophica bacterium]|nr:DNA polymerase III subunit delta [Candidatus Omnitrophota bacterium]